MNVRPIVQDAGGLTRAARAGDGYLTALLLTTIATDANFTLTAAQCAGGAVNLSSFTAGRTVTTDTAANLLAALPNLDIGESAKLTVTCQAAFAATWAAGTGVTLAGRATTPASSHSHILITKTSATTVTWTVL